MNNTLITYNTPTYAILAMGVYL